MSATETKPKPKGKSDRPPSKKRIEQRRREQFLSTGGIMCHLARDEEWSFIFVRPNAVYAILDKHACEGAIPEETGTGMWHMLGQAMDDLEILKNEDSQAAGFIRDFRQEHKAATDKIDKLFEAATGKSKSKKGED